MATAGGPNIERDGLVFGYDTNYGVSDKKISTRFYSGVPAVNCAPGVTPTSGVGDGAWTTTEIVDGSITPPRKGARVFKLVAGSTSNLYRQGSYYSGGGFSNNNPQNPLLLGRTSPSNFTTVGTGKYKYGFWVRGDSSNGASDAISIDVADRGGSSRTIGTSTEWYFINTDDSLGSNSSSYPYDFFDLFSSNQNMIIYISDFGIYRSPGTVDNLPALQAFPQFIEYGQTRSYTQSLIDLTRTSTIDVSNVSFDSTGQPTFDGTNDSIVLADPGVSSSTGFSIELIIKPGNASTSPMVITPNSGGIDHFVRFNANGTLYLRMIPAADSSVQDFVTSSILSSSNYHHVIFTFKQSEGGKAFYNGNLENSSSANFTALNWTSTWRVGQRGNNTFFYQGELPVLKVYNRALSAQEVQQNYNAYKNRFNL
jgi:hypothetical protein